MNIIERINASVKARLLQPWTLRHFAFTSNGRKIKKYMNLYQGRRCFFIGNGPSLSAADLTKLNENGEITFAFNRIYNIFDSTDWRPTFYISQDEKMLKGCVHEVDHLQIPCKFVPIQLNWHHNITIHDAIYFNMDWQSIEDPRKYQFSDDVAGRVFCANTGMYTAAQFAAYMGFTEIYLIGVDHHFQISQNNKGEIVVDNTVKDYFTDKYNPDKQNLYIPNTEKSTLTYVAMKKHCEQRGIRVFNATRGGKLEVFERVDFDQLFQR